MLIYNQRVACFDNPKDLSYLKSTYGDLDFKKRKEDLKYTSIITPNEAKVIAYIEYDGEVRQIFVLDQEGDRVEIKKSVDYGGNGFFNSDGFAFFSLFSEGKEKRYVLDNSPYSYKHSDIGDVPDDDVLDLAFTQIEKLMKSINISYDKSSVLFLQEL